MSDVMTVIKLGPGKSTHIGGYMEHGRKTRAEMIEVFRTHAKIQKEEAKSILAATDDQFKVRVVRGKHVQHLIEELK